MRVRSLARRGALVALPAVAAASCEPIVARPLSEAPANVCPDFSCERYDRGTRTAARCNNQGRCEIASAGGRPDYPFWITVHVPDTSIYAPGMTYALFSDERGDPAFRPDPTSTRRQCVPPQCLELDGITSVIGSYTVTRQAAIDVGYPLPAGTSIPVRVVYEPIGTRQTGELRLPTLPVDRLFASSRLVKAEVGFVAEHGRAIPFARYRRILYPQPPFDEYFPPTTDVQNIQSGTFIDRFVLGSTGDALEPNVKLLDDVTGDSRRALIAREEGLEGWRVWLVDAPSGNRISIVRTLSGTTAEVRLDTTGEKRGPGGGVGLGNDVEAVIAPPQTWTAVPRLVSPLFGGSGLQNLRVPPLPPPVTVNGVTAQAEDGGTLLGYRARLLFESERLLARSGPDPLLRYVATVNTDDRGRFATVLPPGSYAVTIEPEEGTGLAKTRQPVEIDRTITSLTLQSPARTPVRGRVVLTDERPLTDAEIVAIPDLPDRPPAPRPARTQTGADGRFTFRDGLDPGPYVFTVFPKRGTGFPQIVHRADIPADATELPDLRVPAPIRLTFRLRDPSVTGNPIVRAVVRILAAPPGREDRPIEIGSGMTDPDGEVEILLAQQPR